MTCRALGEANRREKCRKHAGSQNLERKFPIDVSDSGHHQLPPASGHGPAADTFKHPELLGWLHWIY